MLEIKAGILNYLLGDSELRTLLNSDSNDDRVYSWNPPQDIVYSDSKRSAIFYRLFVNQKPTIRSYPQQFSNMFFYLRVVSKSELDTELISEQIIKLLDEQYGFLTDNWSIKKIVLANYNDGKNEGTPSFPLYVKNLSFSFNNIFQR